MKHKTNRPPTRKRFGQHFLHDKTVIKHMIDVIAPLPSEHLVEIGPGHGALTLPILKKAGTLDVIELDRDLIPFLKQRCMDKGNVIIHQADALSFDYLQLIKENQPIRLIGNLPYNISTPLIFHLISYASHVKDMHFMLQKEVVDRLAARTATEHYGRLSIMVQYHCSVQSVFHVRPDAFSPPPRVDSSLVRLVPYHTLPYLAHDYEQFALLVKTAFMHRRKTLRNCLKQLISDEVWEMLPIDPHLRPEQISLSEYVKLSNLLEKLAS